MPLVSRAFIKSGLACLVLALIAGVPLAAAPGFGLPSWIPLLFPTWIHLLVVGWLTQLIFGVAYWMFPRSTPEHPRGSEQLGWISFVSLNLGLLVRLVAEPMVSYRGIVGWALVVSGGLQLLAGLAFVTNTWPRIKAR